MAVTIQQISPVAHLPLVLGVVRKLNVAALIDTFCPPHPAHVLSCGRGVEALLLAILDGHHALYKVGARLEERGLLPLLQPDTTTLSLYGAYEEEARQGSQSQPAPERPIPPRPAYGHSKDGRDDLKQVLLSLGVSSDGLPLRVGIRDGNTSDSTETPVAIEECLALGLDGVRG